MKVSNRIQGLTGGGDDGWGVFYKARALKAAGEPILELTIGEHDIRTDATILAAMNDAAAGGHTGYAMVPGVQKLRETVAKRVQTQSGVKTGPENVMITPGGQSALFASHHAVCDEGDKALYIDPYYATYPGTLRGIGAIPVAVQAHAEDSFQPKAEEIAKLAKGAKSLLINSPNNPTGVVYSRETLQGIADTCIANDLWLISDEVYDTQVWEGEHISPRSLPDLAERTLVVGSMSKSHAMTGSRVGWVVGPKEVISHLITLATHTTYGVPGFIQDAAVFALTSGSELEENIAAPFARRREISKDLIAKQNVLKLIPAQGAMYVMLDVRATGLSGIEFAEKLLEEQKIAVMPGESFGKAAGGHIRIAMTIADDDFATAFKRIIDFASLHSQ
ncbi:pyridoxal phosphate-dependent aminotransferase [Cochlodiniinecator piscidefendens]|uniref:pyridoxal phosphate-dependent aminotransferase n=1 Tax=Cochlodiniinecator piscidefendens TaxID=2715756 RepID=UPI00140B1D2D